MISRINDLVNGLDDRYANKEETRKKLAQLEKAVSYFFVFDYF
jgi:predicted MPP superfamily phosphohydrolase